MTTNHIPDATKMVPDALRLADHLERFRSFPDDLAAAAELRRLHAENETLRYEVDAIPAIKEERDALQASLVEAHTTYQAKLLSYEALLIQVAEALEPYADIKPRDWKTDREKLWWAYDAIVERLK